MKTPEQEIIKSHANSPNGLQVVRRGDVVNTYNVTGKLIHIIDGEYVDQGICIHRWIGHILINEGIEVLDGHYLEYITIHKCSKIMLDLKRMEGSFKDAIEWLTEYLEPKVIALGIKYRAVLLPEDIFSRINAEQLIEQLNQAQTISQIFDSEEEAIDWLIEMN